MADLPPRPDIPPPRIPRRDDRPYPLRDTYEPRYDRRDDYRRDYDSRDRSYDRDRDYDRRVPYRPPPRWDDRRGGLPSWDRDYDRDRDRDRYDRRGPPPRFYDRERSRSRERYHERYPRTRSPARSPRRSPPPSRFSYYRPRSRSRSPPRRPLPPSPPRMQSRRRSLTPRRSPPPRSRSPKRIKLGVHSIGSPLSTRSPPPRNYSPSRHSPYNGSSRSRDRSPFSDRPAHGEYSSPRRSDRGSETSAKREDRSPVASNIDSVGDTRKIDKRSRSPSLLPASKETFDSQRPRELPIKSELDVEENRYISLPQEQTLSRLPPPLPSSLPDEKPILDTQGDIVMKSEPESSLSTSSHLLSTKPRERERSPSPPKHPRRREELPRDPWHDSSGPHPPTQPRNSLPRGRGGLIRGRGAFRNASGFAVEPPRAPRNRGLGPIVTTNVAQSSPLQTPNLSTPTPVVEGPATSNGPQKIFANIPEPIIPDYKSLVTLEPEDNDKLAEMDALRKQIILQQKHAFNLTLEYGYVYKATRRALHEFEMSSFDLHAAEARRKSTAAHLELASAGVLGIDFEGEFSREGSES